MGNTLSFVLLLPLIIWSTFQGILFHHATQVEETLQMAIFEGQKQAALQGRFDEEIYKTMRDYLVEIHGYDANKIEIEGTEVITPRGERIEIQITIPKPVTRVIDIFDFGTIGETYTIKKQIMSEYNPI